MQERNYFGVMKRDKDTGSPDNGMVNVVKGPIGLGSCFMLKKNMWRMILIVAMHPKKYCLSVIEKDRSNAFIFLLNRSNAIIPWEMFLGIHLRHGAYVNHKEWRTDEPKRKHTQHISGNIYEGIKLKAIKKNF